MPTRDAQNTSRLRSTITGLVVLGVALAVGLWLVREPSPSSRGTEPPPLPAADPQPARHPETDLEPQPELQPESKLEPKREPRSITPKPAPAARAARRPAQRIARSGRLSTSRAALRRGDTLVLHLDLDDEARGDGPRSAKVVDTGGRVLETTATPLPGAGSGLRLEIDPAWLRPGHYLIQVETAERAPLALRRYFLEVLE